MCHIILAVSFWFFVYWWKSLPQAEGFSSCYARATLFLGKTKSFTDTKIMNTEGNEWMHEGWREENEETVRALSPCGPAIPRGMMNLSICRDIVITVWFLSMTQDWKLWWQSQHLSLAITLPRENPANSPARFSGAEWAVHSCPSLGRQPLALHLPGAGGLPTSCLQLPHPRSYPRHS